MNTVNHSWQPEVPTDFPQILQKILPLLQVNSLTQGLKGVCDDFSVQLRHLGETQLQEDEYGIFEQNGSFWSREVNLKLQNHSVVSARSVCLQSAQQWRDVLDCGTRSLGSLLFGGEMQVQRSAFEYTILNSSHSLSQQFAKPIYARRSIFTWQGERLLLQECYLPTLLDLID